MKVDVSIITASFNKELFISETIDSFISQTYKHIELIIVDDCSSDKTVEIIKSYLNEDARIKLHVNPQNKGANYSRNFALSKAIGKYIIFLDADDVLLPNCVEGRIKKIQNNEFDFCVFSMGTFYQKIGDSPYFWKIDTVNPLTDFLQHRLPWQTMQPIWKKDFLLNINGFDDKFQRLQDVDLHTRALLIKTVNYAIENKVVDCYYRIDEQRKNFNQYTFLSKWIDSALLYHEKFYIEAGVLKVENYLLGTIFKAYLQLLNAYKTNTLTKGEFLSLKDKLLNNGLRTYRKTGIYFKVAEFFGLLRFRVPGINFLISKLIVRR